MGGRGSTHRPWVWEGRPRRGAPRGRVWYRSRHVQVDVIRTGVVVSRGPAKFTTTATPDSNDPAPVKASCGSPKFIMLQRHAEAEGEAAVEAAVDCAKCNGSLIARKDYTKHVCGPRSCSGTTRTASTSD